MKYDILNLLSISRMHMRGDQNAKQRRRTKNRIARTSRQRNRRAK